MPINANSGPSVQFGITFGSTGNVQQYNEDRGPSTDDLGAGMMDPRFNFAYRPGMATTYGAAPSAAAVTQLWNNEAFVDYVPNTASSNGIVNFTGPITAGQTLTITATGAGMIKTTINPPEGGPAASVFALDSTAATINFGQTGIVQSWNPSAGTGRVLTINPSSNLDAGFFTIAGRDMYGFKMTESIAAGNTSLKGNKAFKYISAITASTTITSTGVIVGYSDTYGWPAQLPYVGLNSVVSISSNAFTYNSQVLLSSATITLGATAAVMVSTSPDVRGTYASTTASNQSVRFQMYQGFTPGIMGAITATNSTGLFGPAQFSSV